LNGAEELSPSGGDLKKEQNGLFYGVVNVTPVLPQLLWCARVDDVGMAPYVLECGHHAAKLKIISDAVGVNTVHTLLLFWDY
jgi:hypothetical protein